MRRRRGFGQFREDSFPVRSFLLSWSAIALLAVCLLLAGCSVKQEESRETQEHTKEDTKPSSVNEIILAEDVTFSYFYRGFTPMLPEENWNLEGVYLPFLIEGSEDWRDFAEDFCPAAAFFREPDFEKQCLLVTCAPHGSRWGENSSQEIGAIRVKNGELLIETKEHSPETVYAVNAGGVGHLFVNVLLVDREELPGDGTLQVPIYRAGMAGKEPPAE